MGKPGLPATTSDAELRTELGTDPNVPTEPPPSDPIEQTVRGLTAFGHNLFDVVADPAKNTVISPLSIGYGFGMARAGAGGQTAAQLDRVFGFPQQLHAAFNNLDRQIITAGGPAPPLPPQATRQPGQPPAPPVLAVANGLFIQNGLPIKDSFQQTLTSQYGASPQTVDFSSGQATNQINTWVREQTAQRITKLFDQLNPTTQLVLANAVYLKADWQSPFSRPTTDAPFTHVDGTSSAVPMMHQQGYLRYASGQGWQAVELPYAASELAMRVIVPQDTHRPAELLSPSILAQVQAGLQTQQLDLFLPRWDFATEVNLLPALNKLGLTTTDDFSGISEIRLGLDQAVHRANITVGEWGTEAAAVTGVGVSPTFGSAQPPVVVRADRPFAFEIVHRPTGAPLFVGQVTDPLAQ